jgi:hypothetical protein
VSHSAIPHNYDFPTHADKLSRTKEFSDLAKTYNTTPEALLLRLAAEIKRVTNENAARALRAYEYSVAKVALADLEAKLKAEAEAAA